MLTLGSTKKSCVAQKTVLSTKKIFHIGVNVAQQNYVSHKKKNVLATKKIMWHSKENSCWLKIFSAAQKRNTCSQKIVPVAYNKYMLS